MKQKQDVFLAFLPYLARALRLPFTTASALPFMVGSFAALPRFNAAAFCLGLVAGVATHLSANLINDYADSKSGADWHDLTFYGFFGGSKLIQEKLLPEHFYLQAAIFFAGTAALSVVWLAVLLKSSLVIGMFIGILALGWLYSIRPLQLSYHMLGEGVIFLLFGPALVMGGYFIQTKEFPALKSFLLSLPIAFLVTAILFANEVPDLAEDGRAGKHTLAALVGAKRAYLFYCGLIALSLLALVANVNSGYLSPYAFVAFLIMFPAIKAALILKSHFRNKIALIESSKLTIAMHAFVSSVLIVDLLICPKS